MAGDVPDGLVPSNIDQMNERQLFAHTDSRYVICRYVIKVEMFRCLCGVLLEAGLAMSHNYNCNHICHAASVTFFCLLAELLIKLRTALN